MALLARGSVTDRPWGLTFGALGVRGLTGELAVMTDGKPYRVAFDQGAIVAAQSPLVSDAAVRIALTTNLITSTQVADMTRRMAATPDRDEIEMIADYARLASDQAQRLRRRVVAQRAARAASLERGDFTVEDELTIPIVAGNELDIRAILYLATKNNFSEERMSHELRALGGWFQLKREAVADLAQFGFTEVEKPVLQMLLEGANLADAEDANQGLGARAVRSIVYALVSCGACEIRPATRSTRAAPAAAPAMPRTTTPDVRPPGQPAPQTRPPSSPPGSGGTPIAVSRTPSPNSGGVPRSDASASYAIPSSRPASVPPATVPTGQGRPPSAPPGTVAPTARPPSLPPGTVAPNARPPSLPPGTVAPTTSRTSTGSGVPRTMTPQPGSGSVRIPGGIPGSGSGSHPAIPSSGSGAYPMPSRSHAPSGSVPNVGADGIARSRTISQNPFAFDAGTVRGVAPPPPTRPPPTRATSTAAPMPRRPKRNTAATAEIDNLLSHKLPMLDEGVDHFTLLGLPQTASAEEVRSTYFMLARKLHPDRLAAIGIGDEAREAQRLMAQINAAFAVLNDPNKRAEYVSILQRGGESVVKQQDAQADEMAMKIMRAEEAFRQGEMALRREQLPQAIASFQNAVDLQPNESEYQALLAWAQFAAASDKSVVAAQTKRALLKAAEANDMSPTARFYLGRVERMLGKEREALAHFHEVLRIKPNHTDAASEARVLEQRLRGSKR